MVRMGSRSILSSGFTMRRVCYARASSRRLCKRRRRDRSGANVFMAAGYFTRRAGCQGWVRFYCGVVIADPPDFPDCVSLQRPAFGRAYGGCIFRFIETGARQAPCF